jgi:nitrate reductase NapAB chaperone NapD
MHYSGILVTVKPARFTESVHTLEQLSGIEIFHSDPEKGRIVAVQETSSLKEQETGFSRIGSLPHVLAVELVYHYRDVAPPAAEERRSPRDLQRKEAQP